MYLQPLSSPSKAIPSAGGLKAEDMKVSMQWAMASIPVAAVKTGGMLKVNSGSMRANLGIKCQE